MASVIRGGDNFDSAGGNAVKAWVNFNGTGTVAIAAAFNVSSITDGGVGLYTANFATALPNASGAAVGSSTGVANGETCVFTGWTSSSVSVATLRPGVGYADPTVVSIAIFH